MLGTFLLVMQSLLKVIRLLLCNSQSDGYWKLIFKFLSEKVLNCGGQFPIHMIFVKALHKKKKTGENNITKIHVDCRRKAIIKTSPLLAKRNEMKMENGAEGQNRTADARIFSPSLYH